jgi:molybdopterin-guanine dinucleotide biosynthesis protein A
MGGSKLTVPLGGRPLIEHPLLALRQALGAATVIAKPDVLLPPLPGVTVWIESAEPHHPLVGIVEALALSDGRAVLVCPADLPFVSVELIRRLAAASPAPAGGPGARAPNPTRAPATVVRGPDGRLQPLLGCYQPAAAALLAPAAREAVEPARSAVAALAPALLDVTDPDELFNVNSPEDVLIAQTMLERRRARGISQT